MAITISPTQAAPAAVQPSGAATPPVVVQALGHVLKHPGSEDLTNYPLLIHGHSTTDAHGVDIRTEDHQIAVRDIIDDVVIPMPNEAIAAKRGTTVEHVRQAVAFATKKGYLK